MGRGCKTGAAAQEHLGDRCTRAGGAGQAWISKPTQNQTAPTWESARSSTDGQGHTSPTRMSQRPSPISSAPRLCSARLCTVGCSPPLALPVYPGSPQFSPGGVVIRWNCLAFSATSPATRTCPLHPSSALPDVRGSPVPTLDDLTSHWTTCPSPWPLGPLTSFPQTLSPVSWAITPVLLVSCRLPVLAARSLSRVYCTCSFSAPLSLHTCLSLHPSSPSISLEEVPPSRPGSVLLPEAVTTPSHLLRGPYY